MCAYKREKNVQVNILKCFHHRKGSELKKCIFLCHNQMPVFNVYGWSVQYQFQVL